MPNWCLTNYAVTGESKQVKGLYKTMEALQDRKESLLPNGFGKTWLGNLVSDLGFDPEKTQCRGDWSNLKLRTEGGKTVLRFDTETAWCRCSDVEELIQKRFPDVDIYFLSEELGCEIFETNDIGGENSFFPEQFIIDRPMHDGCEYYTEEGFLQKMSEIAGKTVGSFAEAAEWAAKHNEVSTRDYVYVYQAEQPNY